MSFMPKILIVDDEPRMCESLAALLNEQKSYEILTCNSAGEAVGNLEKYVFDLVLLDLVMGDENGYAVMDHINSQNLDALVVIITGHVSTESAVEALRKGAYDYIRKPYEPAELLATVKNALNQQRLKRDNKLLEEARKKAYDDLEKRVKERTADLVKLNKQLEYETENCRKTEERYRFLFENAQVGIGIVDLEGNVITANPYVSDLTGYSLNEAEKIKSHDLYVESEKRKQLLEELKETGKVRDWETELKRKDGNVIDVLLNVDLVEFENQKVLFTLMSDITRINRLQEQLIISERLAATGQLATSIAHEINSPLQAITFILNEMKKKHALDEELSDNVDLLKGAFTTIRDTVKNLLDLNRPGQEKKQQINVNNVIKKTVDLVRSRLKKGRIKVNLDLSSKVPDMAASPQQLSQLLLNLINNATESITGKSEPKGGPKTAKGRWMSRMGGGEINIATNQRNESVVIKVSDDGPGVSDEDLHQIFDPFYTRKKKMGLGVGLSVCHGIMKNHGGTIVAENASEGGAVFTITLPL